jgi:hypothetical protein
MECLRNGFFVAGLCICLAATAAVAPARIVRAAGAGTASSGRGAPAQTQHEQELDDLHRRDVARDLKARGLTTRWQDHELGELLDWRDRIDAARALATEFGVQIDWRSETAVALADMRLRAAKAAAMRASYGIIVDWRRYTWAQIEGLRLSLVAMRPGARDGLAAGAIPTGARDPDALAPFDPNRRYRRPAPNPRDPDAIFEPVFASVVTARSARRFAVAHPDGLLEPTFPRRLPRPSDRNGDGLVAPGSRR